MLELTEVLVSALHLLAVDVATVAPFVCIFLEWRETARGDLAAGQLGRKLVDWSLILLTAGIVLGTFGGTWALAEALLRWEVDEATHVIYPPRVAFSPHIIQFDLIGISHYSGENVLPPESYAHNPIFARDEIKRLYHPETLHYSWMETVKGSDEPLLKKSETTFGLWMSAVWNHPFAYLRHRFRAFGKFLGISKRRVWYPFHGHIDANELGVSTELRPSAEWARDFLWDQATWLIYKMYVYYLLGLAGVGWVVWKKKTRLYPLVVLWLGGTLYWVLSFPLLFACDLRYHSFGLGATAIVLFAVAGHGIERLLERRNEARVILSGAKD